MSIIVALCTPEVKPGAVKFNTENIKNCIAKAKKADIVVFPRLSITGATCGSMYSFPLLTSRAMDALNELVEFADKPVIVGLPIVKDVSVYDAVAIINNGSYSLYTPKKGITDAGNNALLYGNDIIPDLELDDLKVRVMTDIDEAASSDCDFVIVPAAYPSYVGSKNDMLASVSRLTAVAVVSSGKGESVSGKIMSGDKIVFNGKAVYEGYDEEMLIAKVGKIKDKQPQLPLRDISLTPIGEKECAEAYEIMGRGIIGRMNEIGTDKVILGLSGGLDSANVLVAAVLAFEKNKLDKRNIICVTMRGSSSSKRTQDNAASLIEAYKVTGLNVPIDSAISLHMRAISHDSKDVVYENAQARERTQILLNLSNKFNALMLGTGDLSEICLGWSTFGGDQLSQYNPNCSLTKTAIRALLNYYSASKHNKAAAKIIDDILATPVSPELLSGQETEAILGPYEVHDYFITEIVAKRLPPKEALAGAMTKFNLSETTVKQYMYTFLSRLFKYQFKRNFGPDGVQLFPYALNDLVIRSDFSPELWLSDCGL